MGGRGSAGARIEASKAPRGWNDVWGGSQGCPLPTGGGVRDLPRKNVDFGSHKWANFSENWVLFVQFT